MLKDLHLKTGGYTHSPLIILTSPDKHMQSWRTKILLALSQFSWARQFGEPYPFLLQRHRMWAAILAGQLEKKCVNPSEIELESTLQIPSRFTEGCGFRPRGGNESLWGRGGVLAGSNQSSRSGGLQPPQVNVHLECTASRISTWVPRS